MTATENIKSQIEALISGEVLEKVLIPELTYTDLDSEDEEVYQTYLWSVLFATGYLTDAGKRISSTGDSKQGGAGDLRKAHSFLV